MTTAAIGLGSNLGDRAGMICAALTRLRESGDMRVTAVSSLYETEPWGDPDQDRYINACALLETALAPQDLLQRLIAVETSLGRVRDPARRYGPRSIDLDILFYGDLLLDLPGLTLPHPRLFERAFVLLPLSEIAAEHVIAGRRIADAAREMDASGIVRLSGPGPAGVRP